MFTGSQSAGMTSAALLALLSVGCFGNKNPDVATNLAAPPAAAYPDTSGAMNGAPGAAPSPAMVAATSQRPSAPSSSPVPAPFSLREGEQLVPYQVQSGDNLSNIAAKYNTSIGRIQSANGMSNTKIIAGKTIQVPTSAPPTGLAQTAPAGTYVGSTPAAPSTAPVYSASASGAYPSTMSQPSVPTVPAAPSMPAYPSPGAISAPPVPQSQAGTLPGYPSSTSYPRTSGTPATPSFEASRIQFSN